MAQHPACRVDRPNDTERKRPLAGRIQVGDERHAHGHHRACTERLDHAAGNQRVERGEALVRTLLEQLHHPSMRREGQPGEAATSHEPKKKITRQTRYTRRRPEMSDTFPMNVMLTAYDTK